MIEADEDVEREMWAAADAGEGIEAGTAGQGRGGGGGGSGGGGRESDGVARREGRRR
jgi:hypothetical protein